MSRPTQTPHWARNMQKLAPGIYLQDKAVLISEPEICQHLGIRYNRAASLAIDAFVQKVLTERVAGAPGQQAKGAHA